MSDSDSKEKRPTQQEGADHQPEDAARPTDGLRKDNVNPLAPPIDVSAGS